MARSFTLLCVVAAAACILIAAPRAESAVSCNSVASALSPCISYIRGMGPLTGQCCGGVRNLNGAAQTTPDRQLACNCLKSFAGRIPGVKFNLAAGVPAMCKVNIPYAISPSTDCSRVK